MNNMPCICPPGGSIFDRGGFGRRRALQASGAGFVAALSALLVGAGRTARAQPADGSVPVVDGLSVRVVTDNYTDRYSIPLQTPGIKVERIGATEKVGIAPHATLRAEWGLSMVAESVRGSETRRVMVDYGFSPEVLLTNLGFLGIDPATIDAMVLSHGHYDHFGGLTGLLAAAGTTMKPGLPLFVGGEDCFCSRQGANGVDYGVIDRPAILAAGLKLMIAEGPALAAGHAVTSGQIPKTTREDPLRVTYEKTGMTASGLGCDPALEPAAKNTGAYLADDFQHEIATSYVVRDKGLVILTSCSHRGLLNTINQAQASTGVTRLHAVIGGFHLPPPLTEGYVQQTVDDLKAFDPDYVFPAHCSGERFYDLARAAMPGRIVRSSVGARFSFGTKAV